MVWIGHLFQMAELEHGIQQVQVLVLCLHGMGSLTSQIKKKLLEVDGTSCIKSTVHEFEGDQGTRSANSGTAMNDASETSIVLQLYIIITIILSRNYNYNLITTYAFFLLRVNCNSLKGARGVLGTLLSGQVIH